jgi:hypothetical protein
VLVVGIVILIVVVVVGVDVVRVVRVVGVDVVRVLRVGVMMVLIGSIVLVVVRAMLFFLYTT